MRVLLDTCVLSETQTRSPNQSVVEAVQSIRSPDAYLSVITLGEIRKGISLLRSSVRKTNLQQWLKALQENYQAHILPITHETALLWGEQAAKAQKNGFSLSACDGLIAATAVQHGLHLMTRNVRDFRGTDVMLLNPW